MIHNLYISLLSLMVMFSQFNIVPVLAEYDEDGEEFAVSETDDLFQEEMQTAEDENFTAEQINTESDESADTLEGEAYAVVTSAGALTFFRSNNTYENGVSTRAVDIAGKAYTGKIYSGIETTDYRYMEQAPWHSDYVRTVSVASGQTIRPINTAYWFYDKQDITSINLTGLDTSQVTNMSGMFFWCESIKSLDLSGFDTSYVTNMSFMFSSCYGLTNLNLSSFDTDNVTEMSSMFDNCQGLTSLDLSSFDTSRVTNMSAMFRDCQNLSKLNLSSFNTVNVTDMDEMFADCYKLVDPDLTGFDTSKVTSMRFMFYCCQNISVLDMSAFNTGSIKDMENIFGGCISLNTVKLGSGFSKWPENGSLIGSMWVNNQARVYKTPKELCEQYPLNSEDWSGTWELTSVPEAYAVLTSAGELIFFRSTNTYANGSEGTAEDIFGDTYTGTIYTGFETTNEIPWNQKADNIKTVYVAEGHKIKPSAMKAWFYETRLESFDSAGFDTSNITDMSSMFEDCGRLVSLDLSAFNTSNVTNMSSMFSACRDLKSLDLSSFDTGNVTLMNSMFSECNSLESLNVSSFDTGNVTNFGYMFYDCRKLTELDVSSFDTSKATIIWGMFMQCFSLKSLDVSNFDTSKAISMNLVFGGCFELKELDLSSFDTSNVNDFSSMFLQCKNLEYLDLSSFNMSKATVMSKMFDNCDKLNRVKLGSGFNKWLDESKLPQGLWKNTAVGVMLNETELYEKYPSNASDWAGIWELSEYSITDLSFKAETYTINRTEKLNIMDLLEYSPEDEVLEYYTVESENPAVIEVSGNELHALSAGTAMITVKLPNGLSASAEFIVNDIISADSATMALEGLLKVNFYVTVPEEEAEHTYIRMKLASETKGIRVKASEAKLDEETGRRFFQCPIASTQMNEVITMTAEDEEGNKLPMYTASGRDVTEGLEYSAMTYINNRVNSETTAAALKTLLKATGEYGRYAQKYFGYGTLDKEPEEINDVNAETLLPYKTEGKSGECEGITMKSATLECVSGTNVHVYFTLGSTAEINEYVYEVNGASVKPVWNAEKQAYRISSKDIASTELENMYEFNIRKKGETEGISLTYGAFSFGYSKLSNATTQPELAGMVKAQYKYNQAAKAYFNNQN